MAKPRPIKLKIDVTKILKEHLFKGNKGTYLDLVVWPNKDGKDQYGNTHYVVQEPNRAARDAGERGPIIGNLTLPENDEPAPAPKPNKYERPAKQAQEDAPMGEMETDDIPF